MAQRKGAWHPPAPILRSERDPEACLRRASEYLELGGLQDAAYWTRLAADAIAEKKRGH